MSTAEQKCINPCVAAPQIARAAACHRTSPSARDRSSTAVADRDDVLLCDFWIRAAAGEAIVSRRELPPRLPSLWQGELPIDLTSVRAVRASASYPQDNATPSARSKYIEAFVSRPRPSGSIANFGLSVRPPSTVWHPSGPLVRLLHWRARFCCRVVSAADKGKRRSRQRMHQRGGVAVSRVTRARCSKRANCSLRCADGLRKGLTRDLKEAKALLKELA
jgi:hypothetical protein